ncbi:hypothetical protein [Actinoplanes couchii]|uniref:Thiopeptide-type bacteriocin biosynthesis domain-containing protein n=1 Tax=Actinoplanes couchii TaxID=403638 RepID=A0ABQ3XLT0_9ACTN|nr:hypothetical protein [Actinoplanes couchii]MDR6319344.1 hypothetical protein [Actinoplanes couchii]GID59446.1 hypothetical protein Aco03nite_078500 [Actinoplanes couchii]
MGSDAEIYVFDYRRYRGEVVPALLDLLRGGEPGGYLTAFVRDTVTGHRLDFGSRWPEISGRLRGEPARWCRLLGDDLRFSGVHRAGRDLICPDGALCALHRDPDGLENLNVLFEALVCSRCLDRPQFIGRGFDPYDYWPLLDAFGVPAGDRVRRLLSMLCSRGAILGYPAGATEGVHGWLTEPETAELAHRLSALPLPQFEATYPAMRDLHYASLIRTARARLGEYDDGPGWTELSLSFVRTVATVAAAEGRAVLWGNDVGYDHWIDHFLD